jgi:threonine dehydrogenase-like Zn-dependent dehydrogenase
VTIVGARRPAHLDESAAAADIVLAPDDLSAIESALADAIPVWGHTRGDAAAVGRCRMTTTAFLGLGTMGRAMATSALRAGIPTIVWNREPEATRNVAELGAEVAETAARLSGEPRSSSRW